MRLSTLFALALVVLTAIGCGEDSSAQREDAVERECAQVLAERDEARLLYELSMDEPGGIDHEAGARAMEAEVRATELDCYR